MISYDSGFGGYVLYFMVYEGGCVCGGGERNYAENLHLVHDGLVRFEDGFGVVGSMVYRGTSLIRNSPPLGPYNRTMPRALWGP
jgi:hypothetical protein